MKSLSYKKSIAFITSLLMTCATVSAVPSEYLPVISASAEESTSEGIAVNETNFPDPVFRQYILDKCANGDDHLTPEEISSVKAVIFSEDTELSSLEGIKYFTELVHLTCTNNQLTSLDLSGLKQLGSLSLTGSSIENLDVSGCISLERIEAISLGLKSINVQGCTSLTVLACINNPLTTLDVSGCTALNYVDCTNGELTSLNAKGCTSLEKLLCYNNKIETLDISGCTAIKDLECNKNKLTSLDISQCTALTQLYCGENQLTSLDVSSCTALGTLYCQQNQLTSLDVSKNSSLNYFSANGEPYTIAVENNVFRLSELAGFDASRASGWNGAEYNPSDNTITLSADTVSYQYNCGNGKTAVFQLKTGSYKTEEYISIDETNFPDENFRSYISSQLDFVDKDGKLTLSECARVTILNVTQKGISDLTGIEHFKELTALYCDYNSLEKLDLSQNTKLTKLYCTYNQIKSLDVSGNTVLTEIYCHNNQLTSLDVSGNTALTKLYCPNNQLKSLDTGGNTALAEIYCNNNQLTSLDVSGNTALTKLYCSDNCIAAIDLTANTALTQFNGSDNTIDITTTDYSFELSKLENFDPERVTQWTNATYDPDTNTIETDPSVSGIIYTYDCGNNFTLTNKLYRKENVETVTAVDETNFPDENFRNYVLGMAGVDGCISYSERKSITEMDLHDCGIKSLKGIEYFTGLTSLNCSGNELTSLDLSKNTALTTLYCNETQLTSLNVSKNTALTTLYCNENQLTDLDVSNNTKLTYLYCDNNKLTSLDLSNNTALTHLYASHNKLTSLDLEKNTALENVDLTGNLLEISSENNCFKLSQLEGFDVSRVKSWNYGIYNGDGTVTALSDTVIFIYDLGNGKTAEFAVRVSDYMDIDECINAVDTLYDEGEDVIVLNALEMAIIEKVIENDYNE